MLQLHVSCKRDEVEQISEMLEESGALSITLTDKQDNPILEPEIGTTPLWPTVEVLALFAEPALVILATKSLETLPDAPATHVLEVAEQDWERKCLESYVPLRFGRQLWVCPSWLTPPDPEAVTLVLDPGLAFGTGTHATTALCLNWLDEANLAGLTVIDFGCGSGILGLAALKLGAGHVFAVDVDGQALIATQSNAELNDLDEAALTLDSPEALEEPVDLILANILLAPLMQLRQRFRGLLKPQGKLVVSGILDDQAPELIAHYKDCFRWVKTTTRDGWSLLVFLET